MARRRAGARGRRPGDATSGSAGHRSPRRWRRRHLFSEPYLDETLAFVVKDHLRGRFETWASIQEIRDLTIGVPPLPYYEQALKARLPEVRLQEFDLTQDPLSDQLGVRRGRAAGRARLRADAAESRNGRWSCRNRT